jgi:DNA-binding response OmpR family regulator
MTADMAHVLVVDDDARLRELLRRYLTEHGFTVATAADAREARQRLADLAFDLIVLDVMLPQESGLELTRDLRRSSQVPILLLTARGEVDDRISGLESGADDYLAKPFAVEELVARLRAVLRRPASVVNDIAKVGRLAFDFTHRSVTVDGRQLELPRRELLVLEALMRRMGRTVQRASLEEAVYSFDDEVQSNALDTHVSRLRRKFADADAGVEIHGIRGVGYLLRQIS